MEVGVDYSQGNTVPFCPLYPVPCRYYKNANNLMAAAKVLHCMSTSNTSSLQLSGRIELLSRAVMCASSQPMGFSPDPGLQEFIQETRDKLEVAQIQLGS